MAVSKTRMQELVHGFDAAAVDAALSETPALLAWRDKKGRNWLHLAAMTEIKPGRSPPDSVRTADVLLKHGLPLDGEAFTEGDWKATPLWHAVSRGRNPLLAEHLLKLGCDPNYSLWAASFNDDLEAIALLLAHGADIEDPSVPYETPLLGAVMTSHFVSAEALLKAGANPNAQDAKGMTALHLMLKKGSDKAHFPMFVAHGARGDIANLAGQTPREIMRRKQDPDFGRMAEDLA